MDHARGGVIRSGVEGWPSATEGGECHVAARIERIYDRRVGGDVIDQFARVAVESGSHFPRADAPRFDRETS